MVVSTENSDNVHIVAQMKAGDITIKTRYYR